MTLVAGTKLGPYEILAPLGAGGMGEVYRARDSKLDRDVAIKVLPQSVAADPDTLARFEREAKAVAALSHPNILSIFDFGTQDGVAYAVMELLEGETLRGKLDAGPIPQKQAVDYALQIAKGLSAAHEKGIVHRDLKPENLFVTQRRPREDPRLRPGEASRDGRCRARRRARRRGSGHTEPGTVMGTVGYMSPEQVQGVPGRPPLGHLLLRRDPLRAALGQEGVQARDERRDDGGDPAGRAAGAVGVGAQHFPGSRPHRQALPGEGPGSSVPVGQRHRLQPLGAVLADRRERRTGNRPADQRPAGFWVAVLPFKYGDADADLAALADGLSEEIATGLSRFRYLSVVASASAARLKGETGDERALGARLGARYVLEGSIRKGGSAIRVSAQLVDTQTGAQLWSETYNRDLQASSIFAVQDDVAARIVATVADSYGVLVHSMRSAIRQKDDADLTPVEWQFQYFAYREQITPSAHAALKSRLERVVERDDRQSDLWACLAQIYVDEYAFGFREATRPLSIGPWPRPAARWSSIGRTSSRSSRWRRCTSSARTSRRLVLRPSARWP